MHSIKLLLQNMFLYTLNLEKPSSKFYSQQIFSQKSTCSRRKSEYSASWHIMTHMSHTRVVLQNGLLQFPPSTTAIVGNRWDTFIPPPHFHPPSPPSNPSLCSHPLHLSHFSISSSLVFAERFIAFVKRVVFPKCAFIIDDFEFLTLKQNLLHFSL